MTANELLATLENYFGEKYNLMTRQVMSDYLNDCSSEFLEACLKVLLKRCSRVYGKAPGIAEIERYEDEILDSIPEETPPELPEPEYKTATPEETAEFLKQMRGIIKDSKPMAKTLLSMADDLEGR